MEERALDSTCGECGSALVVRDGERPLRCEPCFDSYLRDIDNEFLQSYATLGVTTRRTVAETCLRGLVLEQPPARKVLAMAIMEQFLLSSADLIGLTHSLRHRHDESIVRSFLSFRLDGENSSAFFDELEAAADGELLDALGLPAPDMVSTRYSALEAADARELSGALTALVRDLRATGERAGSALLLSELAGQVRAGPALASKSAWLGRSVEGLRADQVASLVLDERRRQLVVQAVSVDEDRLGEVVDAIDCMTRAASNLIYAYLTVQDEEERLGTMATRLATDEHR